MQIIKEHCDSDYNKIQTIMLTMTAEVRILDRKTRTKS
jgi:hypothetical protein